MAGAVAGGDRDEAMAVPAHVAIIMDGNGRWAKARGLPRSAGHRAGLEALRRIVRAAPDFGMGWLTLYAFSSENWTRPQTEVNDLMGLLKTFIRRDLAELHKSNVRIRIIGGRDGLKPDILALLTEAEALTRNNSSFTLVIAFNYGSRDEIARAARNIAEQAARGVLDPTNVDAVLFERFLDTEGIPDPDLVIRTSGEQRMSNFLMWQAAYSELVFVPCYWPDFGPAEMRVAFDEFTRRERRFGGVLARDGAA
jgi:undecaprenyl diphosphate synthase